MQHAAGLVVDGRPSLAGELGEVSKDAVELLQRRAVDVDRHLADIALQRRPPPVESSSLMSAALSCNETLNLVGARYL